MYITLLWISFYRKIHIANGYLIPAVYFFNWLQMYVIMYKMLWIMTKTSWTICCFHITLLPIQLTCLEYNLLMPLHLLIHISVYKEITRKVWMFHFPWMALWDDITHENGNADSQTLCWLWFSFTCMLANSVKLLLSTTSIRYYFHEKTWQLILGSILNNLL